jgi:hypothetical protein
MARKRPAWSTSGAAEHFTPEQLKSQRQHRQERKVVPDTDVAIERVIRVFRSAPDIDLIAGMQWYRTANAFCMELAVENPSIVRSVYHAAGIVAALSPQGSWEQNQRLARELVEQDSTKCKEERLQTAREIMQGDNPAEKLFDPKRQNRKVRSFFMNIAFPDWPKIPDDHLLPDHIAELPPHVTLDRHAWSMLFWDRTITDVLVAPTKKQYEWGRCVFVAAAEQLGGILPHELQAVTWVVWRNPKRRIIDPNSLELFPEF